MNAKLLLLLPLLASVGCQSEPKRIDPGGDERVTSAGVDYAEIIEWITQKDKVDYVDGLFRNQRSNKDITAKPSRNDRS